tara:strand:- start:423 stop:653 length:231 start_codon:yes stop_codon:yes gene_type:complete
MNKNLHYKRNGLNIVIIIHDENWRKLDTFKFSENNQKLKSSIMRTIKDKYGIFQIFSKAFKPTIDQDINWLGGDLY